MKDTVVLLIDDQPFVGEAVRRLIGGEPGIELRCCHAPTEALRAVHDIHPHVVLLDIVMPDVDGLALLAHITNQPATADIPVIVLSGNDDAATRAKAIGAGARDVLQKLPSREQLLAQIRRHADRGGAGAPAPPPTSPARAASDEVTLDRGVLDSFRRATPSGHADITQTLIDMFVEEASRLMDGLRAAAGKSDLAALQTTSHALRGAAMTIGARRLGALAAQLEDHSKRRSSGAVVGVLVKQIDRELGTVQQIVTDERKRATDS